MSSDECKIEWIGPCVVVRMDAEIDVTNADQAGAALRAAASEGKGLLIIDMSATTFCDSAGIRAIVLAHRHAAGAGVQVRLVATAVERILTLAGVGELIPIYPTVESALTAAPSPE